MDGTVRIAAEAWSPEEATVFSWTGAVAAFCRTLDRPATARAYRSALLDALRLQPRLDMPDIADINPMHLLAWREAVMGLPLSSGSRRQRIAAMRSFIRWTYAMGWHDLRPERAGLVLRLPEKLVENPREALMDDEVQRLLGAAERRGDLALIAVEIAGGLRVSEVSALDVRDLHAEDGLTYLWVRNGKGARSRAVPLLADVAAILARHCDGRRPDMPMFLTRRGRRGRLRVPGVRVRLTLAAELAGIQRVVTPHMLRHTCGMRALAVSGNVMAVAKVLGHQDIRTTQGYLDHLNLRDLTATLAPLPRLR